MLAVRSGQMRTIEQYLQEGDFYEERKVGVEVMCQTSSLPHGQIKTRASARRQHGTGQSELHLVQGLLATV